MILTFSALKLIVERMTDCTNKLDTLILYNNVEYSTKFKIFFHISAGIRVREQVD